MLQSESPLNNGTIFSETAEPYISVCRFRVPTCPWIKANGKRLQRTMKWAGVPSGFCVSSGEQAATRRAKVYDGLLPTVHRHGTILSMSPTSEDSSSVVGARKGCANVGHGTSVYCHQWHKLNVTKRKLNLLWVLISSQHNSTHSSDHQNQVQVHSGPQASEVPLGELHMGPVRGKSGPGWFWELAGDYCLSSQDFSPRWDGSTGPSSSERPVSTVITREAKEVVLAIGCSSAENKENRWGSLTFQPGNLVTHLPKLFVHW